MTVLADDVRTEIMDVLTSSITGLTGHGEASSVFEYEVDTGVFLGIDPRTDDEDVIATIYIYIADLEGYTNDASSLDEHDTITTLLQDIQNLLTEAFEDSAVNTDAFPTALDRAELDHSHPGRYYSMTLPHEPAPQDTPE